MLEFGQADPISGGVAGWSSFGIAGLVLAWLLLRHLPDKDRQLKDLMDGKDANVRFTIERHKETVSEIVTHYRDEIEKEREASERRYAAAMAVLAKIHDSTREGVHATRNLAQQIQYRNRLADAVQSAEVAVWTKGLDGTVTSWNQSCERLLGWKQGEIVGRSVLTHIIPPDRVREEEEILRKIGAGQTVDEYETERMTRDGRKLRLLVLTSPIRDQSGRVIGASTIARERED